MTSTPVLNRILSASVILLIVLLAAVFLGISTGPAGTGFKEVLNSLSGKQPDDQFLESVIWRLRFPRVLMAALVGAALSLGGLVFQAILRNPLAEPYILGVSGGSAIGAIIGILLGLARFPGVSLCAFIGSMGTLLLVLFISSGRTILKKDSLLLSGVIINAFCSAVIMFLISMAQDYRLHSIMYWMMGDLSSADLSQIGILACMVIPCFLLIFLLAHAMNALLMGEDMAGSMGIHVRAVIAGLLVTTSFMVSVTVCYCGLLGFVGLVMPHMLRLLLGPDHRVLVPACLIGGGAYMIICDMLARVLPRQGEMPCGVITAMIGAPVFIFLLRRARR